MAAISEEVLKNTLAKEQKNIFLIYGEDDFLKKMYVEKIYSKVVESDDIFNFQKFESDSDLQEVYDAAMQLPMMVDKKCVILCDYDFEHASKTEFEKLCSLLVEVPETCVFILWFDTLKFEFKKNAKLTTLSDSCEKAGGVVANLSHRTIPELEKMLCTAALKRGCRMSSAVARRLIEVSGEDINTLKNELEKLCLFVKSGDITIEIVEKNAVKTVESEIFSLSNQIFGLDVSAALQSLDELFFERVEPIIILSTISATFVDIYRVYAGKNAGININKVAEEFGYGKRTFVLEKATKQLSKLSFKQMCLCFDALREADRLLKSYSMEGKTVLEQLVVRLIYIIAKGEEVDKS